MLRTQLMRTMHDALLHYVTAGKMMRRGKDLLILASRSEILCLTICTGWNKYMDYGGHSLLVLATWRLSMRLAMCGVGGRAVH